MKDINILLIGALVAIIGITLNQNQADILLGFIILELYVLIRK